MKQERAGTMMIKKRSALMTMMSKTTMRNEGGQGKVISKRKFMRKMEWILKIIEMVLCLLKQGQKKLKLL